jgi:YVTN family beta-propeller protein
VRPERLLKTIALVAVIGLSSGCDDDATGPDGVRGVETGVVVNSTDISITIFPVDSPQSARTIGLAQAGSPVSLAVRKHLVVVPLGQLSAAAVVDLATSAVRAIPLPENSGATGAAFLNDSIVYVANSSRNTVSVLNVSSGTTVGPEIPVGVYPQAIAIDGGSVFVLNAELDVNFQPARPGRISVIDAATNNVLDTVVLSGLNPAAAAFGPDGLLYVVNSGSFGQGNGSLSVVDPVTLEEVEHHTGFGDFPGDIALDAGGRAYVSSFAFGVAIWDTAADSFIKPPSDPLVVQGQTISSGVGVDSGGRLYTLIPGDCSSAGVALRLDVDLSFDTEIDVGACPIAIAFTRNELP